VCLHFETLCAGTFVNYIKGKAKISPRTGHEGPEGSTGIDLLFL
jgi:hypothetical protein